ncbi:Guanine nucleotide-binding protein alpha-2 subunit [Malassezia caprae]|uniref:Guanine nucleotide-binding protein alpha-3 subunit n=1 Tax=Malassezia caprae TaxID=1381934 RepID=A0AAF0E8C6_9BASI|nr:Guanine nucleotide-binding protein alpha-2 subunit [Malassezia caprae]
MGACFSSSSKTRDNGGASSGATKTQERRSKDELKVLLLGSGESGKSTIVKQMKIIHQDGYSEQELYMFRITILKNLLDSIKALALALRRFDMEPQQIENREAADLVTAFELPADVDATLPPQVAQAIMRLWSDPVMAKLLERRGEFYVMDNFDYFLNRAERVTQLNYLPTQEDVLHSRSKTSGIVETNFAMGDMRINLVDVGGQRSERTKWIHSFESVTSIIFCVALSEYDQMLLEDPSQNRMAESLVLFESVVNSRWFLRTSVILFLNKIDIFTKKLPMRPLADYFPDYKGGDDVNKAAKYILWRFTSLNRAKLQIYPHITQATDTNNIRLVFAAVKEYVRVLTQNSAA